MIPIPKKLGGGDYTEDGVPDPIGWLLVSLMGVTRHDLHDRKVVAMSERALCSLYDVERYELNRLISRTDAMDRSCRVHYFVSWCQANGLPVEELNTEEGEE